MNFEVLWSLRLGFSRAQAPAIREYGLEQFLEYSLRTESRTELPEFLDDQPETIADVLAFRSAYKDSPQSAKQETIREVNGRYDQMRQWWLTRMRSEEFPFREKMACFWHNHFVAASQKVRVVHWVYQHNSLCRQYAFGNFRELTKQMVRSNAVITYLDNTNNRRDKLNENLSRELLELFTLGIGNYTETDIKEGAKALAGLSPGDSGGVYRRFWKYDGFVEYLGGRGKYDADDLVDKIFEQPESPYLITRKIIQWLLYDEPDEDMVLYYGDYLREVDFEIAPLLRKLILEESDNSLSGQKIKDPLSYAAQLMDELHFDPSDNRFLVNFLKQQGMHLLNQPNVKGWPGGRSWLSTQVYVQRKQFANLLCAGLLRDPSTVRMGVARFDRFKPQLDWNDSGSATDIKEDLSSRLLFRTDDQQQIAMEELMSYDFDPKSINANRNVARLFNYLITTPEFQLI